MNDESCTICPPTCQKLVFNATVIAHFSATVAYENGLFHESTKKLTLQCSEVYWLNGEVQLSFVVLQIML